MRPTIGYRLTWQAMALSSLLAVPVLFLGSLWLMFQDYTYAEAMVVRVLFPAILLTVVLAWRKRRRKTS